MNSSNGEEDHVHTKVNFTQKHEQECLILIFNAESCVISELDVKNIVVTPNMSVITTIFTHVLHVISASPTPELGVECEVSTPNMGVVCLSLTPNSGVGAGKTTCTIDVHITAPTPDLGVRQR